MPSLPPSSEGDALIEIGSDGGDERDVRRRPTRLVPASGAEDAARPRSAARALAAAEAGHDALGAGLLLGVVARLVGVAHGVDEPARERVLGPKGPSSAASAALGLAAPLGDVVRARRRAAPCSVPSSDARASGLGPLRVNGSSAPLNLPTWRKSTSMWSRSAGARWRR